MITEGSKRTDLLEYRGPNTAARVCTARPAL